MILLEMKLTAVIAIKDTGCSTAQSLQTMLAPTHCPEEHEYSQDWLEVERYLLAEQVAEHVFSCESV